MLNPGRLASHSHTCPTPAFQKTTAMAEPSPNLSTGASLTPAALQFVEQFAALLAPWGLPPAAGRVYGYLILKQQPVSVDDIAADLSMSRVGAWNSAKSLESFGHVRRSGVTGSKKALYSPSDNFAEPLLKEAALMGSLGSLLQTCASDVATADAAPAIRERATFYSALCEQMQTIIEQLNQQRGR